MCTVIWPDWDWPSPPLDPLIFLSMTREHLLALLKQSEDNFVERKLTQHRGDVVKTLVAFANSVPLDREAVLFIGVQNDGAVTGVLNPENAQKDIQTWATDVCYPPISVRCELLDGLSPKPVLAVVVSPSKHRPHFAGPAYIREANKSVNASSKVYDELIASRNEKAGAILRQKEEVVTVVFLALPPPPQRDSTFGIGGRLFVSMKESLDGQIKTCTAHYVEIELVNAGKTHSIPLDFVTLATDPTKLGRLKLIVDGQYRTI